jgi:hypothetical protein
MAGLIDPAPKAVAAAESFLAKCQNFSAPESTTLGDQDTATKKSALNESEEAALLELAKQLTGQLQASGATETQRSVEQSRHNRFILIMAVSVIFLCAVVAISYFARENVLLALFGNGGVCVAFIGFLKFAMDQQLEDHRLELNARIVELFGRVVGQVDKPGDLIRVSETFAAVLRERTGGGRSKKGK